MSKETKFEWNDALWDEFKLFVELKCGETNVPNPSLPLIYKWKDKFQQSKTKVQVPLQDERIKVEAFHLSSPPHKETVYVLHLNKLLPEKELPNLKEVIEKVLNDPAPIPQEDKQYDFDGRKFDRVWFDEAPQMEINPRPLTFDKRRFTQSEVDTIRKEANFWTDERVVEILNTHRSSDYILAKVVYDLGTVSKWKKHYLKFWKKPEPVNKGISLDNLDNRIEEREKYHTAVNKEQHSKEWEILSFKDHKNENEYYTQWVDDPTLYCNGIKAILYSAKVLIEKDYSIHSVHRTSDNEVFTIGDKVGYNDGVSKTKVEWAIDNFFLRQDGILLARGKDNLNVEIVNKNLYKQSPETLTHTVTDNSDVVCLSLNDFSIWYERWYPNNPMKAALLHGLKELVKQKLKQ